MTREEEMQELERRRLEEADAAQGVSLGIRPDAEIRRGKSMSEGSSVDTPSGVFYGQAEGKSSGRAISQAVQDPLAERRAALENELDVWRGRRARRGGSIEYPAADAEIERVGREIDRLNATEQARNARGNGEGDMTEDWQVSSGPSGEDASQGPFNAQQADGSQTPFQSSRQPSGQTREGMDAPIGFDERNPIVNDDGRVIGYVKRAQIIPQEPPQRQFGEDDFKGVEMNADGSVNMPDGRNVVMPAEFYSGLSNHLKDYHDRSVETARTAKNPVIKAAAQRESEWAAKQLEMAAAAQRMAGEGGPDANSLVDRGAAPITELDMQRSRTAAMAAPALKRNAAIDQQFQQAVAQIGKSGLLWNELPAAKQKEIADRVKEQNSEFVKSALLSETNLERRKHGLPPISRDEMDGALSSQGPSVRLPGVKRAGLGGGGDLSLEGAQPEGGGGNGAASLLFSMISMRRPRNAKALQGVLAAYKDAVQAQGIDANDAQRAMNSYLRQAQFETSANAKENDLRFKSASLEMRERDLERRNAQSAFNNDLAGRREGRLQERQDMSETRAEEKSQSKANRAVRYGIARDVLASYGFDKGQEAFLKHLAERDDIPVDDPERARLMLEAEIPAKHRAAALSKQEAEYQQKIKAGTATADDIAAAQERGRAMARLKSVSVSSRVGASEGEAKAEPVDWSKYNVKK